MIKIPGARQTGFDTFVHPSWASVARLSG